MKLSQAIRQILDTLEDVEVYSITVFFKSPITDKGDDFFAVGETSDGIEYQNFLNTKKVNPPPG